MRGISCSVTGCEYHTDDQVSRFSPLHIKVKLLDLHTRAVHLVQVRGNPRREDGGDHPGVEILRERFQRATSAKDRYDLLKRLGIIETVHID